MVEKVNLEANKRNEFGRKTNKGRKEGLIPAVVYGRGIETLSLWIKNLDFVRLVKEAGESTMIALNINGKNSRNVIIYETQVDPVTGRYRHVDFFQVRMDEEIETEVELVYIGEEVAPAVKELGGVLVKNIDNITVKCLPGDLPSEIEVDVSRLANFEERITIGDLKISEKVKVEIDPETVVALVSPPRSEAELTQLEEKVEVDVTKVEGVVKETDSTEGTEEKKEQTKE